eukprot:sb/3475252/
MSACKMSKVTMAKSHLIGLVGDEDTCTAFLLGGIGELNNAREPNFLVVKKDTTVGEIESTLRKLLARKDIGILLINQHIANDVRHIIDGHTAAIPAVLEIPSKEHPYDSSKDSILRRAKGMFSVDEMR